MANDLMVRNILSVYYSANAGQRIHGEYWYDTAQMIAYDLSTKYGVELAKVAGVIAAVSPQNQWANNVRLAEKIVSRYVAGIDVVEAGGYLGLGLNKAKQILESDGNTETIKTILSGRKIVSFFRNIMGARNVVTVDGHAYNVALFGMERQSINSTPRKLTDKVYGEVEDAYREAAKIAGINQVSMQAITWTVYRSLKLSK